MSRRLFFALVAIGLGWRLWMLLHYGLVSGGEVDVYLADEGVVGLMGKHIAEGRELPVFFYGQSYLGALEAYCAALSFAVFGPGFLALRLVTFCFSVAIGALLYHFAYRFYSVSAARWATALVAMAPMYFLQWNLKARGGFVEHVFLVLVVMSLFWRFYLYHQRDRPTAFALGVACGIALWVNQLVGAYLALMALLLWLRRDEQRGLRLAAVGLALGACLLVGYNLVHPLATVRSLVRKALVMNRVKVEERGHDWAMRGLEARVQALSDGFDKLGIVFGVPPGPDVERLGMSQDSRTGGPLAKVRRVLFFIPLAVFVAGLWAARPRRGHGGWDAIGSDQLLGLFVIVTFVVGYVSPRYMLPAYPLGALLVGILAARAGGPAGRLLYAGIAATVLLNVASWVDAASLPASADEDRGSQLLAFLQERQIGACYSASPLYHLAFASGERVIFTPLQKDRYPPYDAAVETADSICYVFRDDQSAKRQHLALMALLERRHVRYAEQQVGVYRVLYDFEPRRGINAADVDAVRSAETADDDSQGETE